ncbi:carbohydrate sulfotransferase 5-like [Bombina bombina]|uniref:carbohydrate sulfotransferase 5-like n=1 Tax=Bombina bombina TaxID=8345 RepID=UPI00235A48C0|nr:carbohydrate sulfotransferase 5-like [Bombina bombina]
MCSIITFSANWTFHQYSGFSHTQKKPVHLLILTSWRSGSSFLGQIFNHHPDVFYLFEPARVVWVKIPNESAELLHYPIRDLLHSLFNCDVSPLHSYLPRNGRYISDLSYWSESRALCSPPACTSAESTWSYDRPTCFQHCGYVPLEKMSEACKLHSHVVFKVVRILDLKVLLPLFEDPTLDLRILHLVRDPRAVTFSRKNFNLLNHDDFIVNGGLEKNKKTSITEVMAKICAAQVAINKVGASLHKRYMVIRHEDLAREPLYYVRKVYSFADLNLFQEQEIWLNNVTKKNGQRQYGFMNFAGVSREIAQKWRLKLDQNTVLTVQDVCKEAMKVFGYKPVKSVTEQKDLSMDVVLKREA